MSDIDVVAELRAAVEKYKTPDPSTLSKLPKPTKADNPKGKCGECGGWHGLPAVHLEYMGHAEITKALIDIDPTWSWEPAGIVDGAPVIALQGGRLVMWAYLTVLGVRRLGVGTCEAKKGEPEKELIGDFLRNAGMRFGIAVNLWSKADSADPAGSGASGGYEKKTAPRTDQRPAPDTPERTDAILVYNTIRNLDAEQRTTFEEWHVEHKGSLTVNSLSGDPEWCAEVSVFLRGLGALA